MKAFNRIITAVIAAIILIFVAANAVLLNISSVSGRPYRVEINRIVSEIEDGSFNEDMLTECEYVTGVTEYEDSGNFYNTDSDYIIREAGGKLYRIDYRTDSNENITETVITVNIILIIMTILITTVMVYIKLKILKPFEQLTDIPYELSKGNLTAPVKETKNRFFGRFIWGVDILRENMEQQKERELSLQRDKKTLLLSLSHDIKTPLSAIKLYSKALSKGLYDSREKQFEIAENINAKADEIESYVSQIITASREDFLSIDVNPGEFYLSELISRIGVYYAEKLSLIKTEFAVEKYTDCLLNGDINRSIEVLQNIMENAIKYGDGKNISISFSEEEGCILITVSNTGCTLSVSDLPHIFDSFWRGENSSDIKGSGLGLYICRQIMNKMNGEIFAKIRNECFCATAVFSKS